MTVRSTLPLLFAALSATACASDPAVIADPGTTSSTPTIDSAGSAAGASEANASQTGASETDVDAFPSVIDATATPDGDGTWRFSVTISSPYDTAERYADAWRVLGPDGTEYGIRGLLHDHANEQPFTRSQSGIAVPADIDVVTIQGRDLVNGWGGPTFDLALTEVTE